MFRFLSAPSRPCVRPSRRRLKLACEPLETRTVAAASLAAPVIGTITGEVVNRTSQAGIPHIRVDLINSANRIVQTVLTDSAGDYSFDITKNGPYVVREVLPRHYAQVAPTFANTAPTGSYAPGAGAASWSYITTNTDPAVGPVGPAYWSDIAPAGNDPFESPINIRNRVIDLKSVLSIDYPTTTPTDIVNNSHQIQVQYTGSTPDHITAGGVQYNLAQFHYHAPSETTVNGHAYAMEEHFVNTSSTGAESVVAVFLQLGKHNAALDPILNAASTSLTQPNSKTTAPISVDFAGLIPKNTQGWFYRGSLTTPPLSQPVNWFVFRTPITLDSQQLGEYQAVASGSGFLPNARPVQALDGRVLNENNYDVNFQGQSVVGQDFTVVVK